MESENVLDIRENKLLLLFYLLGTIQATQLLQVILDYELQVPHEPILGLHELNKCIARNNFFLELNSSKRLVNYISLTFSLSMPPAAYSQRKLGRLCKYRALFCD